MDDARRPGRIDRFFRALYRKLFAINDTPQRIAAGVGLGVFCGVLPGSGPIAALFLAMLFRVNKAAALLGSILTNTWISIPVFLLSARAGALMTGSSYAVINREWSALMRDFTWGKLGALSAGRIAGPVAIGYLAVSSVIALAAYAATLGAVIIIRKRRNAGKGT